MNLGHAGYPMERIERRSSECSMGYLAEEDIIGAKVTYIRASDALQVARRVSTARVR